MAQSLSKFFGIWFAFVLLSGAVLFFMNGSADTLNPALEAQRLEACKEGGDGFKGNEAQECLEEVESTLERLALETRADLLFWFVTTAVAVLIVGMLFMVRINQRSTTAGSPADFRSMRGPWFVHLVVIAVVCLLYGVLAQFSSFFGAWGGVLSPAHGWGIPAVVLMVMCLSFWLGSKFATPDKMKPSIP